MVDDALSRRREEANGIGTGKDGVGLRGGRDPYGTGSNEDGVFVDVDEGHGVVGHRDLMGKHSQPPAVMHVCLVLLCSD